MSNTRTRPRWRFAAPALVTTLALAGAACGSSGQSASSAENSEGTETTAITVVLDWTPNTNHAGMYLAEAEGWYDDAGLDVTFVEPGESSSLALLAAGRADVAVSVQEELIPARAEGLPVRSVAAVLPENTSSLVSLASDDIEEPADLAGATYGGFGGQLEQELLERLVECAGGDSSSVTMVDVGEADYRVGLERDQYDVVWIFDGWDGIRLSDLEDVDTNSISFADQTDCIPNWYTPLLATSEKFEQDQPEALTAFLDATSRGYQLAMSDPAASAEALLAATDGLDPALVEASATYLADQYAETPATWGMQESDVWTAFSEFLVDAELIAEPIDVDAAWTNEYLPSS